MLNLNKSFQQEHKLSMDGIMKLLYFMVIKMEIIIISLLIYIKAQIIN